MRGRRIVQILCKEEETSRHCITEDCPAGPALFNVCLIEAASAACMSAIGRAPADSEGGNDALPWQSPVAHHNAFKKNARKHLGSH